MKNAKLIVMVFVSFISSVMAIDTTNAISIARPREYEVVQRYERFGKKL